LVGGIGVVVQFATLFLLKSVLHFNYLVATAIAVELAVVHNFVWHERFTWGDRTRMGTSGAESRNLRCRIFAALKRCATERLCGSRSRTERLRHERLLQERYGAMLRRLVRFNLGNGAVSMVGNLGLMKLMVGQVGTNYLVANAVAIVLCSGANFLVSETWVFARE
jgi:putative flippase GtrA